MNYSDLKNKSVSYYCGHSLKERKKEKKIIKLFLLLLRAELPSVVYWFTWTRLLA